MLATQGRGRSARLAIVTTVATATRSGLAGSGMGQIRTPMNALSQFLTTTSPDVGAGLVERARNGWR
jgi:hypothetical protein